MLQWWWGKTKYYSGELLCLGVIEEEAVNNLAMLDLRDNQQSDAIIDAESDNEQVWLEGSTLSNNMNEFTTVDNIETIIEEYNDKLLCCCEYWCDKCQSNCGHM